MKITDDMLTEWFPGEISPVNPGVYMVRSTYDPYVTLFARWDGYFWMAACTKHRIASLTYVKSATQKRIWKGLKEKHHG
ncbi:TPA: hypothetical protein QDB28_006245 [Burkholderia vietnamiensis]|nr:hypothetical protein [Burkholderia vietnamiensis]